MGTSLSRRAASAAVFVGLVSGAIPLYAAGDADVPTPGTPAPAVRSVGDAGFLDPAEPVTPYRDEEAKVSIVPPRGWLLSPATSLDRAGDDQTFELVRYQIGLRDAALYAQPLPVTSGLLADAGAVVSLSLAREGSDLIGADLATLDPRGRQAPGLSHADSETSYDGVVTFTRLLAARGTGRAAVARAHVAAADRDALAPIVLAAIASVKMDPSGPNGPRYVAPSPPPAPEPAVAQPDPSAVARGEIVARAALMLGTPYLWGGSTPGRAMDCSAYVSAAWGVARYTTDSIWDVAVPVAKDGLLPGDAMDLESWRDPARYGHIRLFEAWANAAHTLVWVYEETPPRAIHRVIAYDERYQPMRLSWLSADGVAALVPAPAAMPVPRIEPVPRPPRQQVVPRQPAPTPRPTARPAVRRPLATPKPTPRPTPTHR